MNDKIETSNAGQTPDTNRLLLGIETLIEKTGRNAAVYLNTEINKAAGTLSASDRRHFGNQ